LVVMRAARMQEMLAEAEAELSSAENAVVHLRQVVDGLRGLLNGPSDPDVVASAPVVDGVAVTMKPALSYLKPMDAVMRALEAHPNRAVPFKALWAIIQDRNWADPDYKAYRNAADAAARRLAKNDGPVRRLEDGRYLYSVEVRNHSIGSTGHGNDVPQLPVLNGSGPLASTEAMT
jgi:hypothetical protein